MTLPLAIPHDVAIHEDRRPLLIVGRPYSPLIRRALERVTPGDVDAFSAQMKARIEAARALRGRP
jgi:hypothetical protein